MAPPRATKDTWFGKGVADENMVWKRKIAYIDLTRGKISSKLVPKEARQLYLGGRGIDMYLLYNHVNTEVDPLSTTMSY